MFSIPLLRIPPLLHACYLLGIAVIPVLSPCLLILTFGSHQGSLHCLFSFFNMQVISVCVLIIANDLLWRLWILTHPSNECDVLFYQNEFGWF